MSKFRIQKVVLLIKNLNIFSIVTARGARGSKNPYFFTDREFWVLNFRRNSVSVSSLCSKISLGISLSLFENAHVVAGTFFNRLKGMGFDASKRDDW